MLSPSMLAPHLSSTLGLNITSSLTLSTTSLPLIMGLVPEHESVVSWSALVSISSRWAVVTLVSWSYSTAGSDIRWLSLNHLSLAAGLDPDTTHLSLCFLPLMRGELRPNILTSVGAKLILSFRSQDTGLVTLLLWARHVYWTRDSASPTCSMLTVLMTTSSWCSELASSSTPSRYQATVGAGDPWARHVRVTVEPEVTGPTTCPRISCPLCLTVTCVGGEMMESVTRLFLVWDDLKSTLHLYTAASFSLTFSIISWAGWGLITSLAREPNPRGWSSLQCLGARLSDGLASYV